MSAPYRHPVTDHAVLRWIECYGFVDVEAIRAQILQECRPALQSGASRLTINGVEYRIKDGRVVTLIQKCKKCRKLKWKERP